MYIQVSDLKWKFISETTKCSALCKIGNYFYFYQVPKTLVKLCVGCCKFGFQIGSEVRVLFFSSYILSETWCEMIGFIPVLPGPFSTTSLFVAY